MSLEKNACLFARLLKFVVVEVMGVEHGAKQELYHSATSLAL